MQIIIPMSGFGERFKKVGYTIPKPLIEIEGKPIIGHVVDMFPNEKDFIFICNQEHLDDPHYNMKTILNELCPTGRIISISPHKLGPVYAVLQAMEHINLEIPTIVNYCDFTCYWNWNHFKKWIIKSKCDGAIPAYKGFHPHTLGTTNYAYLRENQGWLLDIQEKQPFTNDRMNEYASSGTYYFSSGKLMIDAFKEIISRNLHINNEYYVSLAYKILLKKNAFIGIYDLQHFMQWGTPEDVAEYLNWSKFYKKINLDSHSLVNKQISIGSIIIPMAGLGKRFTEEGYSTTKPLIPISGKPMVIQATDNLPRANNYVFVLRNDMPEYDKAHHALLNHYPGAIIKTVSHITEGQACTALIGLDALESSQPQTLSEPIIFSACDNGVLFNQGKLNSLLNDNEVDVIVWGATGHINAIRHPNMYGWIDAKNDLIKHVSVKKPLNDPKKNPIIIGTFIFKRAVDFRKCMQHMFKNRILVNNEYYIDSAINSAITLKLNCHLFLVDHYISWGTPNDLRTFEYWQSCFHKWNAHPYDICLDRNVCQKNYTNLLKQYESILPNYLEMIN